METNNALAVQATGLTEVAGFRGSLLKRAFNLIDTLHSDVDHVLTELGIPTASGQGALVPSRQQQSSSTAQPSSVVSTFLDPSGHGEIERSLAVVDTRTAATRKAVDMLSAFQTELDQLLTAQGLESYSSKPAADSGALLGLGSPQKYSTSEELVRTAAATTSAAARFRTQAAETAQSALKAYVDSLAQVRDRVLSDRKLALFRAPRMQFAHVCITKNKVLHGCMRRMVTHGRLDQRDALCLCSLHPPLAACGRCAQSNAAAESSTQATEYEYAAAVHQAEGNLPQALEAMRMSVR